MSVLALCLCVFFFFKQKTAYEMRISDWSSDVCSSDLRSDPPPALALRVRREHARREHTRWWPVQVAAAAMAALLIANGAGSLVNGAWVAENLGEQHSPHAFAEGGLALIAVGIAVAAGALRRAWLPVSVAAGVPLGIAFGIRGIHRSEEHTSELQSLMRISYAFFCLKKKKK